MVTIRPERWHDIFPESIPLMRLHQQELDPQSPLAVKDETLQQLDELGYLTILAARRESGVLVGYSIWFVTPNLFAEETVAQQGPWYVDRRLGFLRGRVAFRIFEASLRLFQERGVTRVLPHHWMDGDSPRAARFYERHGAKPTEVVYSMRLGT